MKTYLDIADKHGIKTMFVFFDDVWGKSPKIKAPRPTPGTHNSGWVRAPGDPAPQRTRITFRLWKPMSKTLSKPFQMTGDDDAVFI